MGPMNKIPKSDSGRTGGADEGLGFRGLIMMRLKGPGEDPWRYPESLGFR